MKTPTRNSWANAGFVVDGPWSQLADVLEIRHAKTVDEVIEALDAVLSAERAERARPKSHEMQSAHSLQQVVLAHFQRLTSLAKKMKKRCEILLTCAHVRCRIAPRWEQRN